MARYRLLASVAIITLIYNSKKWNNILNKWLLALIQFFPLSIFASYAFWHGVPSNERWLDAFQLGAFLGVFQLIIVSLQNKPINRLILAGNVYLILGGLAVFFEQWWYLQIYGELRESAIILLIIIIGITSTFISSSGFIAVKNSEKKLSLYLLLAAIFVLPASIYFEGQRIYSAVIPIILLALFQRYLVFVATHKASIELTD